MHFNVLVDNLYPSQRTHYIAQTTKRAIDFGLAPTIFSCSSGPIATTISVPRLSILLAYDTEGIFISTSMFTYAHLKRVFYKPANRLYNYIWDLEWMDGEHYEYCHHMFNDDSVTHICRCESHAQIINSLFNVKIDNIVNDFGVLSCILKENGCSTNTNKNVGLLLK